MAHAMPTTLVPTGRRTLQRDRGDRELRCPDRSSSGDRSLRNSVRIKRWETGTAAWVACAANKTTTVPAPRAAPRFSRRLSQSVLRLGHSPAQYARAISSWVPITAYPRSSTTRRTKGSRYAAGMRANSCCRMSSHSGVAWSAPMSCLIAAFTNSEDCSCLRLAPTALHQIPGDVLGDMEEPPFDPFSGRQTLCVLDKAQDVSCTASSASASVGRRSRQTILRPRGVSPHRVR